MPPKTKKNSGGRPPKFPEPRHPVTMTLPERILQRLAEIDPDRACAVVKVTEAVMGRTKGEVKPLDLVQMAPGKSLIVVGPSQALSQIPWLNLIEISPARYLLAIPSGTPIEALEVALQDLFNNPDLSKNERDTTILLELLNIIGRQRRSHRLSKAEILIIDMGRATGDQALPVKIRRRRNPPVEF